jgi:hypothetical protein
MEAVLTDFFMLSEFTLDSIITTGGTIGDHIQHPDSTARRFTVPGDAISGSHSLVILFFPKATRLLKNY